MALFGPFDPSSASWSYSNSQTGLNAERGSSKTRSMENLAAQMQCAAASSLPACSLCTMDSSVCLPHPWNQD